MWIAWATEGIDDEDLLTLVGCIGSVTSKFRLPLVPSSLLSRVSILKFLVVICDAHNLTSFLSRISAVFFFYLQYASLTSLPLCSPLTAQANVLCLVEYVHESCRP